MDHAHGPTPPWRSNESGQHPSDHAHGPLRRCPLPEHNPRWSSLLAAPNAQYSNLHMFGGATHRVQTRARDAERASNSGTRHTFPTVLHKLMIPASDPKQHFIESDIGRRNREDKLGGQIWRTIRGDKSGGQIGRTNREDKSGDTASGEMFDPNAFS